MAAGTFKIFKPAKHSLGNGTITLGVQNFRMALFRKSASATLAALAVSTLASVPGQLSTANGYPAGGHSLVPFTGTWAAGASAGIQKFTQSTIGVIFTASGASLKSIKYAVLHNSAGKVVCFCTLSTTAFGVVSPNTLTIFPNATSGFFTLA